MSLFKYLKHEHYENLISKGSIRIGTLKNYRSSEHGDMVSDDMEGSKRFAGTYTEITPEEARKSTAFSSIISFGENAKGSIKNINMSNIVFNEPNYYIFSMAEGYSLDIHEKWNEKENYNSCYHIAFPKTFFRRITSSLNNIQPVTFIGLVSVQYYDEKSGMDFFDKKGNLPAFSLKDHADFSGQTEIRAVWKPEGKNEIEPITLNNSMLSSYVFHKNTFKNT